MHLSKELLVDLVGKLAEADIGMYIWFTCMYEVVSKRNLKLKV